MEFRVWKSHLSNNPLVFKSSYYLFLQISLVNARGPCLVENKAESSFAKGKEGG